MEALVRLQEEMENGPLAGELMQRLAASEIQATSQRIELLLAAKVHPYPPEDWPAVPWPPY
jgi:hypothetical protein